MRIDLGDCLDLLRTLDDESVDAIVTDPPYGLSDLKPAQIAKAVTAWTSGDRDHVPDARGFMGRRWDAFVPPPAVWDECLRVLKPGGHLLAFAGSRTLDLMGLSIRFAGFELRDSIAWLYGSGFPKSLDVSKAIDKAGGDPLSFRRFARAYAAAVEASPMTHTDVDRHLGIKSSSCYWAREDHRGGLPPRHHWTAVRDLLDLPQELEQFYDEAEREVVGQRTTGLGTGKGATPYIGDSENRDVTAPATPDAERWQGWGTALKPAFEPIVVARKPLAGTVAANVLEHGTGALNIDGCRVHTAGSESKAYTVKRLKPGATLEKTGGSWRPTDGADLPWEPGREYEGQTKDGRWPANVVLDDSQAAELDAQSGRSADSGGASRFFPTFRYQAKAPTRERPVAYVAACECGQDVEGECLICGTPARRVAHSTVKPLDLMRWLVRLVTPPGGTVLDPFAGSGTTVEAAVLEGFDVVAFEREAEYLPLIRQRIERAIDEDDLL